MFIFAIIFTVALECLGQPIATVLLVFEISVLQEERWIVRTIYGAGSYRPAVPGKNTGGICAIDRR